MMDRVLRNTFTRWTWFVGLVVLANSLLLVNAFQPITVARLAAKPQPQWHPGRSNLRIKNESTNRIPVFKSPSIRGLKQESRGSALEAAAGAAAAVSSSPGLAWWYMTLLALQFGTQPILTKKYAPTSICRSTIVLAQEVTKFFLAGSLLWVSGSWAASVAGWTVKSWWVIAGIPAALYVVQNYCTLMAYQNLAPVTFNVLNQTKTLSAALCCYLVMGRKQSALQMVSLVLLLVSALVIEKIIPLPFGNAAEQDTRSDEAKKSHWVSGVIPIMIASFISGLAGALTQRSLQDGSRNSYLFTMELSAASILMLIGSLLIPGSPDAQKIKDKGARYGWTWKTLLPVFTNASGGVVVGLVTKHAGAVRKGFALIFGLLLSGILQTKLSKEEDGGGVTPEQIVGGILASVSLWMHASFPYVPS